MRLIAKILKAYRNWKIVGLYGCDHRLEVVATLARDPDLITENLGRDLGL